MRRGTEDGGCGERFVGAWQYCVKNESETARQISALRPRRMSVVLSFDVTYLLNDNLPSFNILAPSPETENPTWKQGSLIFHPSSLSSLLTLTAFAFSSSASTQCSASAGMPIKLK